MYVAIAKMQQNSAPPSSSCGVRTKAKIMLASIIRFDEDARRYSEDFLLVALFDR